jgi:hypothetical protein
MLTSDKIITNNWTGRPYIRWAKSLRLNTSGALFKIFRPNSEIRRRGKPVETAYVIIETHPPKAGYEAGRKIAHAPIEEAKKDQATRRRG